MRIILIGNYRLLKTKSMFLYTNLLKKTLKENKVNVSELYASPILNVFFKNNKFISKWLGYIDKYLFFGIKLIFKIKKNDLVHIVDHANSLLIPFIKSKRIIITCHDLINLKKMILNNNHLSFTGKIYQKLILNNLKKANIIICISKNTQKELIKFGKINKNKTKLIYHTFNQNFSMLKNKQKKFKYFFHIGDNKIYKNRIGVIEIFNELLKIKKFRNYKLILAGKKISEEIFNKIKSHNLNTKIINIVDPNSNKLSNLYKNSEGLIFPSIEEGFGWPIIEAQSLGCVVYTTNKPPMNEVGGDGCIYIYPKSPKKSAKIIHDTYNLKSKINSLAKINLEKFEYNTFTKKYLDTYKLMNDL